MIQKRSLETIDGGSGWVNGGNCGGVDNGDDGWRGLTKAAVTEAQLSAGRLVHPIIACAHGGTK
jgi:hypothetical protein